MIWGIAIVLYLFLAGLGAGAYFATAVVHRTRPDAVKTLRAGRILAPVVVAIGLLLLMVDAEAGLHNPLRFFYLVSNLQSVMSWGVIILALFMVVSLVGMAMDLAKKEVPFPLEIVGCVIALAVAAYTGVLLGVVETFPLWHSPLLPLLFVVSATSTGVASVVLAGFCFPQEQEHLHRLLVRTRLVLPAAEIILVLLLLATTQGNPTGAATVESLLTGSYAVAFWLGLIVVGLVFPLGLSAYELIKKEAKPWVTVGAEAAVLVGGFLLRYLVVIAALPIS